MRLCSVARDDDASVVGAGFSAPLNPDFAGSRKHYWGIAIYDSTVSRIASAGVGGQHKPHKCRNHMLRKRKPAPPSLCRLHTGHKRAHRSRAATTQAGGSEGTPGIAHGAGVAVAVVLQSGVAVVAMGTAASVVIEASLRRRRLRHRWC